MNLALWIESFRIAFREMLRHRTRSILTMFGVIIGVGAIIAVISISEGADRRIQGQIAALGTNMIIILPGTASESGVRGGTGSAPTLSFDDARAIERDCSAVRHCAPVMRIVSQAVSELANWTVPVFGATWNYLEVRNWPVTAGRPLEIADDESSAKVCVIGETTRMQLFGDGDPIGQRIRVKGTVLEIVGLLSVKGQNPLGEDQDDCLVLPVSTLTQQLSGEGRPHALVASAVTEDRVALAMNQMTELLRQRHRLADSDPEDFSIKSMEEYARMAESTSLVMRTLLVSIAGISLLVGGIGIMNIMLVTVMERIREIGIRMAVGATRSMIMRQFLIEASTLAGVGGLLGVVLGVIGSEVISYFTTWPGVITSFLLFGPMVFAVGIGLIFGLLPARRASSLSPVESLRHD